MRGRRSSVRVYFVPRLGDRAIEDVSTRDIERWRSALPDTLSVRSKNKLLTELHGVFKRAKRVWDLPSNPVEEVEQLRERPAVDFEVYTPEEVMAVLPPGGASPPHRPHGRQLHMVDGGSLAHRHRPSRLSVPVVVVT
jgi:hypothetical protein